MSKAYFMVAIITCLGKHSFFSPKMPDISHCDYLQDHGKKCTSTRHKSLWNNGKLCAVKYLKRASANKMFVLTGT